MQFATMVGKSLVGWEEKISEITEQDARLNLERLKGYKNHKPYSIPGAELIKNSKG